MKVYKDNPCNGFYGKCLDVKITNACMGRCAFCIERGGFSPSPCDVEKLIEQTVRLMEYQNVLILGGEPLMYPDLFRYIDGILPYKKNIYLTTNGGPGDTTLNLPLYLYKTSMTDNNYGYANMMGVVLIVAGIIAVQAINKLFRMNESDY